MRFFIVIFLLIVSCAKQPKAVLICGDHECINKAEAEFYFKENLSLEVKIIDPKNKSDQYDLVELNLKNPEDKKKTVKIVKKSSTNRKITKLSKIEIRKRKSELKKQKIAKKQENNNKNKIKENKKKQKKLSKKIAKKQVQKMIENKPANYKKNQTQINDEKLEDICLILKKCDIDEITNYLIKKNNDKKYPSLTIN